MHRAKTSARRRVADEARKHFPKGGACYTFARLEEEAFPMKIKSPKDFWSGLMFIGSGLFFMIWGMIHYQMGTAVRMGPAYFPTVLGGLLAVLGAMVLAESLMVQPEGDATLVVPFNIVDLLIVVAVYVGFGFFAQWIGLSSDWAIILGTAI